MPSTDNHSIIYVRVSPEDKARLRALADRQFGGSMARAVRYLIKVHITGRQVPRIYRHD